jgi:hypothetical protein
MLMCLYYIYKCVFIYCCAHGQNSALLLRKGLGDTNVQHQRSTVSFTCGALHIRRTWSSTMRACSPAAVS